MEGTMMRMGFLFSEAFWGIFLILLGITIVLKAVFGINIPLFKTAFALLLIYAGLSMLAGGNRWPGMKNNTIIFSQSEMKARNNQHDYHIIFGSGVIDLSGINPETTTGKIEVTTIFGSGVLKINPDIPVVIKVDSVFANAHFPDGTNISFGDYTYHSPRKAEQDVAPLEIEADVVFGDLTIVNSRP
jgi:hypothetical protein